MLNLTPLEEVVAANVRAELARRKLGTADLSLQLGCSRRAAQNRWNGDTAYSVGQIEQVAAWLGVPVDRLTTAAAAAPIAEAA